MQFSVQIITEDHPSRKKVEAFIASKFLEAYGATITHFMPNLVCVYAGDDLVGAFGYRQAHLDSLFLEQYLDKPIDRELMIQRQYITEVGNFVAIKPGMTRWLIRNLKPFMLDINARWLVFTGIPQLINTFEKLGLDVFEVKQASIEALPLEDHAQWGSYYDTNPKVVGVFVAKPR